MGSKMLESRTPTLLFEGSPPPATNRRPSDIAQEPEQKRSVPASGTLVNSCVTGSQRLADSPPCVFGSPTVVPPSHTRSLPVRKTLALSVTSGQGITSLQKPTCETERLV